jgi:hypothetical protein
LFCKKWQRIKNRSEGLFCKYGLCLLQSNSNATKIKTIKQLKIMKKITLFLLLLLLATSCATTGATKKTLTAEDVGAPVYYDGNNEPVATSGVVVYSDKQ